MGLTEEQAQRVVLETRLGLAEFALSARPIPEHEIALRRRIAELRERLRVGGDRRDT